MESPITSTPLSRYYAVVVLYQSSSEASNYETLYEEEIAIVLATSDEDARERAIAHAKEQEDTYRNGRGELVTHQFKVIKDVHLMPPEIESGTTIYSRFFRDLSSYEAFEADASGRLESASASAV